MVGLQGTRHEVKGEGSVFVLETSVGNSSIEWQWCVHIKRCKLAFLLGKLGVWCFFFSMPQEQEVLNSHIISSISCKTNKKKVEFVLVILSLLSLLQKV